MLYSCTHMATVSVKGLAMGRNNLLLGTVVIQPSVPRVLQSTFGSHIVFVSPDQLSEIHCQMTLRSVSASEELLIGYRSVQIDTI